jgi:hypothetical protein
MKNFSAVLLLFFVVASQAQTPFQRVYTTLNTKCQNSTCHSATATDASAQLLFDGNTDAVHAAIFGVNAQNASSIAKHEKLVKQQHPYYSFLLRKIAGADFDTDLAIDTTTEGALMKDINGNVLTKKEIEFIRQWITFGAKKTYSGNEPQPNWGLVNQFYDSLDANGINRFLPKPQRPAAGQGIQLRMGPIFLPITGEIEQEYCQQQEVYFENMPEVHQIDGFMNQQSHHFLLFKYVDTAAAKNSNASNVNNLSKVTLIGNTSFDGDKDLTASWQNDANLVLPEGTALFWDKKTVLDMNYHIKNFNASFVLPCDFYFNIYYKDRSPNTIEMKSQLSQKLSIFLPTGTSTSTFSDPKNGDASFDGTKYLWMVAGHTHEWGTDFDLHIKNAQGVTGDKFYDGKGIAAYGGGYYDNSLGYWDWHHPPIEYWPNLLPIEFGGPNNAGIVSKAYYNNTTNLPLTFSTQTNGEMQLWYYMYTEQPLATTGINSPGKADMYFEVMPNPMNQNGKLVYTLTKTAKVESTITDLTGKAIAHMSSETEQEGTHEITIGNNEKLASGIYFAKLSVDGVVYTKKFIVTE